MLLLFSQFDSCKWKTGWYGWYGVVQAFVLNISVKSWLLFYFTCTVFPCTKSLNPQLTSGLHFFLWVFSLMLRKNSWPKLPSSSMIWLKNKSDCTSWLFEVPFNLKIQHSLADMMNSSSELPADTVHVQHVSRQAKLSRIMAVVFDFYCY